MILQHAGRHSGSLLPGVYDSNYLGDISVLLVSADLGLLPLENFCSKSHHCPA